MPRTHSSSTRIPLSLAPRICPQAQGVNEYILDLRSNPGGLVSAGIDIAALWLDGEKPVFTIQGREVRTGGREEGKHGQWHGGRSV